MYKDLSQLIFYTPAEDSILRRLAELFRRCEAGENGPELVRALHGEIGRLFAFAAAHGLDGNVWQSYLTCELLTSENAFSLACEGKGDPGGTLSRMAKHDLEVYRRLFAFSFSLFRRILGISFITGLLGYDAGTGQKDKDSLGALIQAQRDALAACESAGAALTCVSDFYRDHGVGDFAFHRAFRLDGANALTPCRGVGSVTLSDLVGYELQKRRLRDNTEAFLAGLPANNALLYGDAGSGKSTCVRALVNEYPASALRLVELTKPQLEALPDLMETLAARGYRFLIFIDDLSFEEHETGYKHLKAAIEGGLRPMPENVRVYATSNRRHIIRETWNDRADMEHSGDIHRSDTVEEKLSLAGRFGTAINFSSPDRALYHEIVRTLAAKRLPFAIDEKTLLAGADRWELRHGGVSGRAARQYIDDLAGKAGESAE